MTGLLEALRKSVGKNRERHLYDRHILISNTRKPDGNVTFAHAERQFRNVSYILGRPGPKSSLISCVPILLVLNEIMFALRQWGPLVLFRIGTLIPSTAGLLVQQQASNGSEQLLRLKAWTHCIECRKLPPIHQTKKWRLLFDHRARNMNVASRVREGVAHAISCMTQPIPLVAFH